MTILAKILEWTRRDLKPWQSDAIRRLFTSGALSPADLDESFAMMKAAHGIPDPKNRSPKPLSEEDLPEISPGAVSVTIMGLRQLENVNRISPAQRLTFSPTGLTVVYGDNGSGKSGYARVLKNACRARTKGEPILPNALLPRGQQGTPSAVFDVRLQDVDSSVHWTYGSTSLAELSTVAVFDSHCARAYIDSEGDLIFMPWGLDVVENLASTAFRELERRLQSELALMDVSTSSFADLSGETKVGQLLARLGPRTDSKQIDELTAHTETDNERYALLEKTLAERDPRTKAADLRRDAQRLDEMHSRIVTALSCIDEKALARLRSMEEQAWAALEAERVVAAALRSGEDLLPGTGDAAWKELFQAAKRFAEEHVHPGHSFPSGANGGACPLCQQFLDEKSIDRLHRFAEFVTHDISRDAAEKRRTLATAVNALRNAVLTFQIDLATNDWLKDRDEDLHRIVASFETSLEEKRCWILTSLDRRVWETPPTLGDDPRDGLRKLSDRAKAGAQALEQALDVDKQKLMVLEKDDLRTRLALAQRKDALLALLERMKVRHRLESCTEDLKTKPISDKAKTLIAEVVTPALTDSLNKEFMTLDVDYLRAELRDRVIQGKPKYKLVLTLPGTVDPERILSEGEQRAIALASFMAELGHSGHRGPIVLDDPVSSLDHRRRSCVAKRLVTEAKCRQVIIFTHDTVFLAELLHELEDQQNQEVEKIFHCLDATRTEAGLVNDGLPWHHMRYSDRIDKLEKACRELASARGQLTNEQADTRARLEYGRLRQVVERVVQDVVLCGVIQRYNDYIRIPHLRDIVGLQTSECNRLIQLHSRCGDIEAGHDKASARAYAAPTFGDLARDIEELKAIVAAVKQSRSANNVN